MLSLVASDVRSGLEQRFSQKHFRLGSVDAKFPPRPPNPRKMLGGLGVRNPDVRPPLARSRSHTIPSGSSLSPDEPSIAPPVSTRPTYGRSHSYVSSIDPKPRNAVTAPIEKTSRLHIPGTGTRQGNDQHHSLRHPLRHRHTQSNAESYVRSSRTSDNTENLSHLLAGLNAERAKRQQAERHGTGTSLELKRVTTARSHRSGKLSLDANYVVDPSGQRDLRRRATSDPKSVLKSATPKTAIEIALDRKDARTMANRAALTTKDVERVKREQDDAEDELRDRLAIVGDTNNNITRRLDYTFYSLLEKLSNLIGTIQSFQSLSTQSQHLIENFAHETGKLDEDIKRRVRVFHKGFDDREVRAAELQERGRKANVKAQDLGRRLENARIIVQNWENRENAKQKTWFRIWGMLFWTLATVFVLVISSIVAKEWWFHGDLGRAGLNLPEGGSNNASLVIGKKELSKIEVPPEVREILEGIESRRENKPIWPKLPPVEVEEVAEADEDARLRRLDEL